MKKQPKIEQPKVEILSNFMSTNGRDRLFVFRIDDNVTSVRVSPDWNVSFHVSCVSLDAVRLLFGGLVDVCNAKKK